MFKRRPPSSHRPLAPGPWLLILLVAALAPVGRADWFTGGSDAQRDFWVRTDPKIAPNAIPDPNFRFLWKVKMPDAVGPALLLNRYIGYRGFRALAFVASGNTIAAIDTDLGHIEWRKTFAASGCTLSLTRPASVSIAPAPGADGGGTGRRYTAARSAVGEPDQGAVTVAEAEARAKALAGRGGSGRNRGERLPDYIYALSGDGLFHTMYLSNGTEPHPPVPFLPANACSHGLIVVDEVAYAATPDTLYALDLETKQVSKFAGAASVPSIGPDGTVYAATRAEMVALAPKSLTVKSTYSADQDFTTEPIVFRHASKVLIAAASKDGRLHILDAAGLQDPYLTAGLGAAPSALASWQDPAGTRWLLASLPDSVTAWKLTGGNGVPAIEKAWTSREMPAPLAPMIVNGVVFAASGDRSSPAVLYALDGLTGKELWSSGRTITSSARGSGLSASDTQLYIGANDGMFYAFGFWIERE